MKFPRHSSPACHANLPRRSRAKAGHCVPSAFTLVELLVVIGIISILLVAVIPAVTSLSKSSGRKAAVSNLLGAIEQARAQAIKDGQATYVVFPTFNAGATQAILDRYNYKSYALFEDDPANPTTPKQLTAWKTLPTSVSLRSAISSPPWETAAFIFTPLNATQTQTFPYLKFNASGEVESPPNPAPPNPPSVSIAIFEGYVNGGTEVITGKKDASGNPLATESISVARLTGRATSTQ